MTRYAIGDPRYGMAALTNVSGTPGEDPGPSLPHTGQQATPPPGHKENVQIDAESGARLASYAAQNLEHAAHRAQQEHFARQRDTSPGAYIRHVFGLPNRA
jgi:hypothetical protein